MGRLRYPDLTYSKYAYDHDALCRRGLRAERII